MRDHHKYKKDNRGVRDHGRGQGRGNVGKGDKRRSPKSKGAIRGGGKRK